MQLRVNKMQPSQSNWNFPDFPPVPLSKPELLNLTTIMEIEMYYLTRRQRCQLPSWSEKSNIFYRPPKLTLRGKSVMWFTCIVNIRRKALSSSVGFRKRMTSRSPRGSPCDSCKLRYDRPLWFVWWSDVCFDVLSCFFDHPSIDSTKAMPLDLFGKDLSMFRLDQAS